MPEITFRPLAKSDFPRLVAWIGQPHVQKWWHEPATVEHVSKEYGACTRGDFRTRVYIALLEGRAVGMIQSYLVNDYDADTLEWDAAGYVGIDYLIGDPALTGQGLGSAMIRQFIESTVKSMYPEALGVVADPEVANAASVGALRKAGFVSGKVIPKGEYGTPEQLMMLKFAPSQ
jgi:aminoglycoside 6'-N-acetyltransferase